MEALTPVMMVDIVRTVVMPVSESSIQCMDVTVTAEQTGHDLIFFKTFFVQIKDLFRSIYIAFRVCIY